MIRHYLRLVLDAATSLRAAAGALALHLEVVAQLSVAPTAAEEPPEIAAPTFQAGRLWLLRVGLHEVQRAKERAEDWVWIVDHTIQLGTLKVLVIVGVRLSQWEQQGRGVLGHRDLQVILLEPIEKSNGDVVQQQLEQAAQITGVPRQILSDQCRELNKGIRQFQATQQAKAQQAKAQQAVKAGPAAPVSPARVHDIKHKAALLLERELEADPQWKSFLREVSQTRRKTQQTELAFLAPPTQKEKARNMHFDSLVHWGVQTRRWLEAPVLPEGVQVSPERIEETLGWLRGLEASLAAWQATLAVIAAALEFLRQHGYYRGAQRALRQHLGPLTAGQAAAERMAQNLRKFVLAQSAQAQRGEHLVATSEVLESLIGKAKRIEGQQSKGGFTRLVLSLAAAVVDPTRENLEQALATVKTRDVAAWATKHLGVSLQALRRYALHHLPGGTKLR